MKKLICALALLLTLTFFVGCSQTPPDTPEGMVRVSNDTVDYNLFVPDNWTPETSTGVITAKRSDSVLANISMMAASANGLTDIAEYWKGYTEDFQRTYKDFKIIKENESTLLDEHAASLYVYEGSVGGAKKAMFHQVICIKDDTVYLFTYTADPEKYEEYLPDVEKTLKNFSFKD